MQKAVFMVRKALFEMEGTFQKLYAEKVRHTTKKDSKELTERIAFMKRKINYKRVTVFILVLLTVYFCNMHYKAILDNVNIKNESEKIAGLLETEKKKNEELKAQQENLDSDEYYEKLAREELGYLKPEEKVFIDSQKK